MFLTWSNWEGASRDPRGWSATHVYFTLMPHTAATLQKGVNAADVRWWPVKGEGVEVTLAFDHEEILAAAIARLRNKAEYTSLQAYVLPEEFTLPELQRAYEIILDRPVDKSAFRTRVLPTGLVEETSQIRTGPNRPAQLYRLSEEGRLVFFLRTFSLRKTSKGVKFQKNA